MNQPATALLLPAVACPPTKLTATSQTYLKPAIAREYSAILTGVVFLTLLNSF